MITMSQVPSSRVALWKRSVSVLGVCLLVIAALTTLFYEYSRLGSRTLMVTTPTKQEEPQTFAEQQQINHHANVRALVSKQAKHAKHSKAASCNNGDYSSRTLKLAYERPMAALFAGYSYESKFETSDVIMVEDRAYAVCDSSWSIYQFGLELQPRAASNVRWEDDSRPQRDSHNDDDSDYEGLAYHDGTFYVVRESIEHSDGSYHAIIDEIQITEDEASPDAPQQYSRLRQCSTEFEFEGDSKGFEGVLALPDLAGELVLLGLCEGNHCSETYKRDRGHGKIIVMKQEVSLDDPPACWWRTIRTLDIPSSALFNDYSAISLDEKGFVAITSQEDGQLWVGRLLGKDENGQWDVDGMAFDQFGEVFDFPKDRDCRTVYCNIEGIHWLDDGRFLAVSDKMKSKGKQDFRCQEKDQSVHVFALP